MSPRLYAALGEIAAADVRSKTNWIIFSLRTLTDACAARPSLMPSLLRRPLQPREPKTVKLTIRIDKALNDALDRVSAIYARSKSDWAGLALDVLIAERRK